MGVMYTFKQKHQQLATAGHSECHHSNPLNPMDASDLNPSKTCGGTLATETAVSPSRTDK